MAEEKVKRGDMVTVYGTGSSFMKAGKAFKIHKIAAEKLISKGAASKEKVEAGKNDKSLGTGSNVGGKAGDKK
jgi:hypothetical protein